MAYGGYTYLEFKYKPSKNDFVVLFWVNGKYNLEKLAEGIAAESSVGTWLKINTMNDKVFKYYRARVFKIIKTTQKSGFVYVAYPIEHFDAKNVLQFQASVLGNIFGMKELTELVVLDISFPEKYQKLFKGPKFGIEGIRKYVGTSKTRRPHVGSIVKPKVGLTAKEFGNVAYDCWKNGLDLVKDDENLVDQPFCPWKKRFDYTIKMMEKAEKETGEKKVFASNITDSSIERMEKRLDHIKESGNRMVMLDVYIMGAPALMHMIKLAQKANLFVHAHRAGYAAAHGGNFGVNFQIYEKYYRIMGVDQLHVGTGVGKMEGAPILIKHLNELSRCYKGEEKLYLGSLEYTYSKHIKPMFPVASGGVDPAKVEGIVAIHTKDVIIQAGGGVHGHPKGTGAGARALRTAVECIVSGISLKEAAKKNKDLELALKTFSYSNPDNVRKVLAHETKNAQNLINRIKKGGIKEYRKISELEKI
ncbi:ribulose-bisphosphate carboxylase large subunit [Candidatus Micrarchaeota archaeon]|nr:ribulose-bisphosphate carboxylase large subunit [Candidatus Micrarchaeota archaeon]